MIFTEEQEMFRQEIRRFTKKELAKTAAAQLGLIDPSQLMETLEKIKQQGWNCVNYPEKYGGWHLDYVHLGILLEELYKVDVTAGMIPFFSAFYSLSLKYLPEEGQDEIIPPLIDMTAVVAGSHTEALSGNEFPTVKTKAVREGDYYILNGEKQPTSVATLATHFMVTCKTDTKCPEHEGLSIIIVPRSTPGVTVSPLPMMIGPLHIPKEDPTYGGGSAIVSFDDCRVPAKYLLGKEGDGYWMVTERYDLARLYGSTILSLAFAQAALQHTIDYAKERIRFGRPIIQFEGVSFKIAEHYTNIEAARFLAYHAMGVLDQGRKATKEIATAKLFGCAAAERAIHDCMMIVGYTAFHMEHWMQDRLRNAIGMECADGAEQIQKLTILRELIGPEALPPGMSDKF